MPRLLIFFVFFENKFRNLKAIRNISVGSNVTIIRIIRSHKNVDKKEFHECIALKKLYGLSYIVKSMCAQFKWTLKKNAAICAYYYQSSWDRISKLTNQDGFYSDILNFDWIFSRCVILTKLKFLLHFY